MDLSIFMMPLHPPQRDVHTVFAEDAEAILLADELGFREAWVGEHQSSAAEAITSPLLFLASLIPRTRQIAFASGVICAPQTHPATIAGQAALFDHLSEGRFILGIGPGGLPPDFELFQVADADRSAMMAEAIELVRKIWTSDPPYDLQGRFWSVRIRDWHVPELGLGTMLRPYQRPTPPVAVTAMSPGSGSIRLAAREGYLPVSANFIGAWSVRSHWEAYAAECERVGRRPDPSVWRVARTVFVGESDAEAEDFVYQPGGAFDFYFEYLYGIFARAGLLAHFVPEKDFDPEKLTHRDLLRLVIHGSPETVKEKLLAFREEVGPFGHLLMSAHDWQDAPRMKASMRLLATRVMPELNRALGVSAAPGDPSPGRGAHAPGLDAPH